VGQASRLSPRESPLGTPTSSSRQPTKVRDAIHLIESNGWALVATRGSHRQFKHPSRPGRVTIAGKPSDDLAPGTLNSILKQAGLKPSEGDR
jgi:predicted RNA binding protein YcfA (HicA-like mRNA interferase family)